MIDGRRIDRAFAVLGIAWGVLGVVLAILVLGNVLLGAIAGVRSNLTPVDSHSSSPVYDNFPEKHAFWKEDAEVVVPHFEPYYHWRRSQFNGKYINIDADGVRATVKNPNPGATRIFMFGGSTMWGSGAPDQYTIPSILQSLLGEEYDVYNFGEKGFVSTQELNYLLRLLATGKRPDLVIFYDGVNDGFAGAYSPAIPRDPQVLRDRFRRDEAARAQGWFLRSASELYRASHYPQLIDYLHRLLGTGASSTDLWDATVTEGIGDNSQAVTRMYEAHIVQIRAVADAYGFKTLFFWQPNLFSLSRTVNDFERDVIDRASPTWVRSQQAVYASAKERFAGREAEGIYFLGDIFNDVAEPIYVDWNHIGPNGNHIIAAEMARRIAASTD